MSDDGVFDGIAEFYDLVYAGKDTEAEADYVARLLRRHGVADGARILEWGSGTGRHARALAARGYNLTGVERSAAMLARASGLAGPQLQFLQGDLLEADAGSSYDALIACFHVISYLTDEVALARAFAKASLALKPGGLFLFDVWHGPAVLNLRPETRCARFADDRRELLRVAEPHHDSSRHRVDVHYRYFHRRLTESQWQLDQETHSLRYWFLPEIQRHATDAGLRWLGAEEWLSGRAPGLDSWGVCHLLQK